MNLFLHESIKICIDLQCYALFMDNFWPLFTMRHLVWAIDQTLSMTLPQPCESHLHHHLPSNAQLPTWRIMTVLEIFGSPAFGKIIPISVENSQKGPGDSVKVKVVEFFQGRSSRDDQGSFLGMMHHKQWENVRHYYVKNYDWYQLGAGQMAGECLM